MMLPAALHSRDRSGACVLIGSHNSSNALFQMLGMEETIMSTCASHVALLEL